MAQRTDRCKNVRPATCPLTDVSSVHPRGNGRTAAGAARLAEVRTDEDQISSASRSSPRHWMTRDSIPEIRLAKRHPQHWSISTASFPPLRRHWSITRSARVGTSGPTAREIASGMPLTDVDPSRCSILRSRPAADSCSSCAWTSSARLMHASTANLRSMWAASALRRDPVGPPGLDPVQSGQSTIHAVTARKSIVAPTVAAISATTAPARESVQDLKHAGLHELARPPTSHRRAVRRAD
jgi:hypothetical protein